MRILTLEGGMSNFKTSWDTYWWVKKSGRRETGQIVVGEVLQRRWSGLNVPPKWDWWCLLEETAGTKDEAGRIRRLLWSKLKSKGEDKTLRNLILLLYCGGSWIVTAHINHDGQIKTSKVC